MWDGCCVWGSLGECEREKSTEIKHVKVKEEEVEGVEKEIEIITKRQQYNRSY